MKRSLIWLSTAMIGGILLLVNLAPAFFGEQAGARMAAAAGSYVIYLPEITGGAAPKPFGPTPAPAPTVAATPAVPGVVQYNITARDHVTGPITYVPIPPAGGNHWPIWRNCGFYDLPIPDQEGVHSLEHGAVWITYSPSLPAADIATLKQLAGVEPKVIFSPYPGLPAPVVASAWDFQGYLTGVADPRLVQFIHTYRANPFSGEPNGECFGGDGSPNPPSPR